MKLPGVLGLGLALATALFPQAALAQAPRPAEVRQTHYQIGVMERVLESAVEHGAANLRERLQAIAPDAPAQLLILGNPRVRGFRLDGYGVFFDVEVPSLNGTLTWSLRTLDPGTAAGSPALPASTARPVLPNPRRAPGTIAGAPDRQLNAAAAAPKPAADDSILDDPNEAYRTEVVGALTQAMLDYSAPLAVGPDEWLSIAARGIQDRPRLGPPDSDAQTVMIRLKGADLAAFRAGQLKADEVILRVEKRVF